MPSGEQASAGIRKPGTGLGLLSLEADADVQIASPRSLGEGATQAAPGNHGHDIGGMMLANITVWSADSLGVTIAAMGLGSPASVAYPTSNDAYLFPFRLGADFTVAKLWWFNGATASGNVDCGIYDANFNLKTSAGSTAQSGTNAVQSVDITDYVLKKGLYYLAIAMDNTTGTLFAVNGTNPTILTKTAGSVQMASAFALPSTITPAANTDGYIPLFGLTSRTVI